MMYIDNAADKVSHSQDVHVCLLIMLLTRSNIYWRDPHVF